MASSREPRPHKRYKSSKFKHPLRFYVDLYQIPEQTINNAADRNWPLDNPKKLLEKFLAAKGKKTNLTILTQIVNGKVEDPPETTEEPPDEFDEAMVFHSGLIFELKRLQQETTNSYRKYKAEQRPADRMILQKVYIANVAALRQLAKEAPKAEREAKNVLVVSDVESTWSRAFKEFKITVEALGRRISTNPLFAKLDPVDVEELVAKELVVALSHLEVGSWLTKEPK